LHSASTRTGQGQFGRQQRGGLACVAMSYYRYITGVYKSYWPQLNRTLRSSSVPRSVPRLETVARSSRAASLPPTSRYRSSATPFRDRAMAMRATSVPPLEPATTSSYSWRINSTPAPAPEPTHFTDFDCKVIDYMSKLERQDSVKTYISETRHSRAERRSAAAEYESPSFVARYNFYDGDKHCQDYLYPITRDVMGSWKHYNRSRNTLDARNRRETSPLVSRELDRYFGTQKRNDFVGSLSSGCATDFRHYNYRRVPYLGGSDHFRYLNKMVAEAVH